MKILISKKKLVELIKNEKNLGFVPTMGSLHGGHISLIKKSIKLCDQTIVSIYINRPQFNNKNDYINYPKNIKKDIKILNKFNVDYLFIPNTKEIYPNGINKKIKLNKFSKKLCGKFRHGHFNAVVDVVDRFVKIIVPSKIFLGEKDFQQLKLIENFITKKYKKTKIILCKTIREMNGIACSSRNKLLSKNEKFIASNVYKLLKNNKQKLVNKDLSISSIKNKIYNFGVSKIEYFEILNINKIFKPYKKEKKFKIFISYYLRKIRLIDNL